MTSVKCSEFVNWLRAECDRQQWKYVELRPLSWNVDPERQMLCSSSYFSHSLDLTASREHIFRGLHKDCTQRRIRRAERAGLTYEAGCLAWRGTECNSRRPILPVPRSSIRVRIRTNAAGSCGRGACGSLLSMASTSSRCRRIWAIVC